MVSVKLTFHFFSRKICDKIPSYVNLSICFTVLLHKRENYIALNYPILYAVVLSFSSSGAHCPEIGGGIVQTLGGNYLGRIVRGANCVDTIRLLQFVAFVHLPFSFQSLDLFEASLLFRKGTSFCVIRRK